MPKQSVPGNARGLDMELVKTGRAAVGIKGSVLADVIHHQFCVRRKRAMSAVYQAGDSEVVTPTRFGTTAHRWRFTTGYNCRWVVVRVLTLGGVISTSARPSLTVTTSTGTTTHAYVADAPAPTTTLSGRRLQEWEIVKQVAPNSVETIVVDQTSTLDTVRILSVTVEEMPTRQIDTSVDTWALDKRLLASGTDLDAVEYDDLPLLCAILRRYGKKVLWSTCKYHTTAVVGAGNKVDLVTASNANQLDGGILPAPNRPEVSGTSVNCYLYAEDSVALNGLVDFDFGGAAVGSIANITTGGPAWYSVTTSIAKAIDTISLRGWNAAAGTLSVYAAIVEDATEAA